MRVLVTGAGGQVGRDLVTVLEGGIADGGTRRSLLAAGGVGASIEVVAADHGALAVEDREAVLNVVAGLRPSVVFHLAAMTAVDECESEVDRAFAVNALGTRHVAEACRRWDAHLVYVSTDYVFDGTAAQPYREWDATGPLSVYGRSKLAGEHECGEGATIVRASWVCGAHGANMVKTVLRLASGSAPLYFVDDQRGSPTFTADLAPALATLGLDRRPGVHHVTNQGETTWYGFARAVVAGSGGDPDRVRPVRTADLDPPRRALRPANSVLDNAVLRLAGLPVLPPWEDGLDRLLKVLGSAESR
jgi:dTDP-4-dehydrorhamnose reductase